MVAYNASTVLELPWLERLLLWSIRVWAAYHDEPATVRGCLECAFIDAGVPSALPPFEKMMHSVFADVQYWPDIRCVRCLRLGRDERELLAMLADLEQGHMDRATNRLSSLLMSSQMRVGQAAALEVVQVFKSAGLNMRRFGVTASAEWPPRPTVFGKLQH